jgi:phenylpyruvate tautomerase PptA (4-oxalocrotonate tautomerase family)
LPYLRLYCSEIPVEQKRVIARHLMDITLRTFALRREDRRRMIVQFKELWQANKAADSTCVNQKDDCILDVNADGLTDEKKRAFADEATPMLARSLHREPESRLARFLGFKAEPTRQITIQFNDLGLGDRVRREPTATVFDRRAA